MKKQILKIGKALTRAEQKQVFGGNTISHEGDGNCKKCTKNSDCGTGVCITYSGPDCSHTTCGCGSFC